MSKGSWSQGEYEVVNKEKYLGKNLPFYRSSWEKRFFTYCDLSENVLKWGSEILIIPYYFHVDKKMHKYYTDVYMETVTRDGSIVRYVIEIKPKKETKRPTPPKKKSAKAMRNYKRSLLTFEKNSAKWKSTMKYCEERKLKFKIITEDELF